MRGWSAATRPFSRTSFLPHTTFDGHRASFSRQSKYTHSEESDLAAALTQRTKELIPSPEEHDALVTLVSEIEGVLDKFKAGIEECISGEILTVRQVGSFKKGTILRGHGIVDLVILLKSANTTENINLLGQKIVEELENNVHGQRFTLEKEPFSFTISRGNSKMAVKCLVTFPVVQLRKTPDNECRRLITNHLAALNDARWYEDNVCAPTTRALIRLMKDARRRFEGMEPMNPWVIDILCFYAAMGVDGKPLTLVEAYKRTFQLLAAGLFTPGTLGIQDPQEPWVCRRIHENMSLEDQDLVCLTAQNITRHLLNGNYAALLSNSPMPENIEKDNCVFNGVVIVPLGPVYETSRDTEEDVDNNAWDYDESIMQTE